MDKNNIQEIMEYEVKQLDNFINYHGITLDNLNYFLVEPFEIFVEPEDLDTSPRNMWVVLQEYKDIKDGYSIVFDPRNSGWGITEQLSNDKYILVIGAASFKEALEGM